MQMLFDKNNSFRFIVVSKSNEKYLKKAGFEKAVHVKDFMLQKNEDKVIMPEALKVFNTLLKAWDNYDELKLAVTLKEVTEIPYEFLELIKEALRNYTLDSFKDKFVSYLNTMTESDFDEFVGYMRKMIKLADEDDNYEVYDKEKYDKLTDYIKNNKDDIMFSAIKGAVKHYYSNSNVHEILIDYIKGLYNG